MAAVIDEAQADWMVQSGSSITLASCNAAGLPSLGQGIGCRVDGSRERITIFVLEPRNLAVLADVRAGRQFAAVFTHGGTLRSVQVKAQGAREVELQPGDSERISAYIGKVTLEWSQGGTPLEFAQALLTRGPGRLLGLEFSPYIAFDQTPGPRAGSEMRSPG